MSINNIKKEIAKKLRDKWGYSKHQIDVYWKEKKGLTLEQLQKELERI